MKRVLVVLAFLAVTAPAAADDPISLSLSSHVTNEPGAVLVTVVVQPHRDNRALVVEGESGSFYRLSEVSLEGEGAPRVHRIHLQNLPAGDYTVTATLRASDTTRAKRQQELMVVGGGN